MKHLYPLLSLVQDRNTKKILEEIIKELDRIQSVPLVKDADVAKVRNAINAITGKV